MSRSSIPSIALFPKKVPDRRRQIRVPVQIQVTVKMGKEGTSLLTGDLNRGGLFIRTDDPRRLRELIELQIDLHDDKEPVSTLAVVRHSITPSEAREYGRVPGMGVQFYGMSNAIRRRWEDFTERMNQEYSQFSSGTAPTARANVPPGSTQQESPRARRKGQDGHDSADEQAVHQSGPDRERTPVKAVTIRKAPDTVVDKVRRNEVRYSAPFKVRMPNVEKLHEFMTRDISAGGIFLRTKREVEVGTEVTVNIIHPETEQEFALAGSVVRMHHDDSGKPSGLGIKFTGLDDDTTAELRQFVISGVPDDLLDVGDFLFDDDDLDGLM